MDWKKEAVNDLLNYKARCESKINILEEIKALEADSVSLRGISADTPVMGGLSSQENKYLNVLAKKERLKDNLKAVQRLIKRTERGLACLDKRQRTVLEGFYVYKTSTYVDDLCYSLCVEKSQLYRIKDNALLKFTIAMYGVVDL